MYLRICCLEMHLILGRLHFERVKRRNGEMHRTLYTLKFVFSKIFLIMYDQINSRKLNIVTLSLCTERNMCAFLYNLVSGIVSLFSLALFSFAESISFAILGFSWFLSMWKPNTKDHITFLFLFEVGISSLKIR